MAGLTDISVSNYTKLQYDVDGTGVGVVFADITNVQSIGELADTKTIVDVQEYGVSYLRKLVGTAKAGPIDIKVNYNPTDTSHIYLLDSYATGRKEVFKLLMTDATGLVGNFVTFNGFVGSKSVTNEFDASRTITFSIAIDGSVSTITAL